MFSDLWCFGKMYCHKEKCFENIIKCSICRCFRTKPTIVAAFKKSKKLKLTPGQILPVQKQI